MYCFYIIHNTIPWPPKHALRIQIKKAFTSLLSESNKNIAAYLTSYADKNKTTVKREMFAHNLLREFRWNVNNAELNSKH